MQILQATVILQLVLHLLVQILQVLIIQLLVDATFPAVTTGTNNIAIGQGAGGTLTTGAGNIYINANAGTAAEATTIRIGTSQTACFVQGINNATVPTGTSTAVRVSNTTGQLAVAASSRRFKHDIYNMDNTSENIYKLRPVNFVYNDDITEEKQYGLIAEEVDEVLPQIVSRDGEGKPYSVQYEVLPVLLLNEMKKQKTTIEQQQVTIEKQDQSIEDLTITVEAMNEAIKSLQNQIQQFAQRMKIMESNA